MSDDVYGELEAEVNDATERARQLLETTDGRVFTVRPTPTSWSAAECLAHLSISTQMFLPVLRNALAEARARKLTPKRRPHMDWLGWILRWFLEPPFRMRVKTAAPFVPRAVRSKADAFNEFSSLQSQLVEVVRSARDVDVAKIRIVSPFDKRVKYNVYSAFRILTAHERRHLWQAEQAVAALRRTA